MKTNILERVAKLGPEPLDLSAAAHGNPMRRIDASTQFERNLVDFDNDPPWPGEWDNASR